MLWQLQRTGDVLAVGTYDVAGAGSVTRSMPLRDAADAAKLAVTLESGRTAPARTAARVDR